jgi:predicted AAA+ superfamily ATPase
MNIEAVKEYIHDFQNKRLPELVERDIYVPETDKIVSLIGPRRAGKTYFLFQKIKELIKEDVGKAQILYLNCEDTRLISVRFDEIREIIKLQWQLYPSDKKSFYLFVDEPQNIEKWELAIRSLYDEGIKIVITGSSSKLLSKEIATSLRGRSLTYIILPFSFNEFLKFKGADSRILGSKEKAELLRFYDEYLDFGGFPEIIKENDVDSKLKIITEYLDLVVYKDIVERYSLRNSAVVKLIINAMLSSATKKFSINKMYNTLKSQGIKISKNTLYEYASLLEDVFFIFQTHKFSGSERKKDFSINKVYINDSAYLKLIEQSKDTGKKMENAVFIELLRKKRPLEDIFYWKNNAGEEVDFVITKSKKAEQLIQVCHNTEDIDTKRREMRALLSAQKELKCRNLAMLTSNKRGEEKIEWFGSKGTIKFIPLLEWLIDKNPKK